MPPDAVAGVATAVKLTWAHVAAGMGAVALGLLTLLGFFGKRHIRRMDELEKSTVRREEYEKTIRRLEVAHGEVMSEIRGLVKAIHDDLDRVHGRVDALFEKIGTMRGNSGASRR